MRKGALPRWFSSKESACQCQETNVWHLIWEDPSGHGATKPVCHNFWDKVPQLIKLTHPRACALQQEKPSQKDCARQPEEQPSLAATREKHSQQQRSRAVKNKENYLKRQQQKRHGGQGMDLNRYFSRDDVKMINKHMKVLSPSLIIM